jgi:hypothetical protein
MEGIRSEYGNANDEGVPWEGREGGWQVFEPIDSLDLFGSLDITRNDDLLSDLVDSCSEIEWVERDPFALRDDQRFSIGWRDFQDFVMHESRYFFLSKRRSGDPYDWEKMSPGDIVKLIGDMIKKLGLLGVIEKGSPVYRARRGRHKTARDLGSPPIEAARYANRMSPAGIPMFYGALKSAVSVSELPVRGDEDESVVSIGKFIASRDLRIVDLSLPRLTPSLFDEGSRHKRAITKFYHGFVRDISKPVTRDGMDHIEYVPTQVVTELVRHHLVEQFGSVDGMIYPSAINRKNRCVVLFLKNDSCSDRGSGKFGTVLELVSSRTIPV